MIYSCVKDPLLCNLEFSRHYKKTRINSTCQYARATYDRRHLDLLLLLLLLRSCLRCSSQPLLLQQESVYCCTCVQTFNNNRKMLTRKKEVSTATCLQEQLCVCRFLQRMKLIRSFFEHTALRNLRAHFMVQKLRNQNALLLEADETEYITSRIYYYKD